MISRVPRRNLSLRARTMGVEALRRTVRAKKKPRWSDILEVGIILINEGPVSYGLLVSPVVASPLSIIYQPRPR